ncbi:hypothetical protein [Nosocomiicoccus massiliensis]|uniref:Uncharacterized protein n=1 Tax=Nosocomiicoccus massiliensis TaxID=1232430 RepID=A0AAF1BR86_9STAP|nr:hypothetical protein [Nosocomiicoccus massiliensis]WOS95813.1 hypothetical protein CJ229_006870 [Nosocomiicoccus massiliensis]
MKKIRVYAVLFLLMSIITLIMDFNKFWGIITSIIIVIIVGLIEHKHKKRR